MEVFEQFEWLPTLTVVSSTDMKSACIAFWIVAYHVKGIALLGSFHLHCYKLELFTVVIFAAYSFNGESISLWM